MKKVKLLALILIVCMLAVTFTACDQIFKKNESRDFNQVVATVSYSTTVNGKNSTQSFDILKGDLKASYDTAIFTSTIIKCQRAKQSKPC